MEELVAEMGSAFLCADLQLTPETREDHAAYIASWLKVLKDDKRAVFAAASYASKATEFASLTGNGPRNLEVRMWDERAIALRRIAGMGSRYGFRRAVHCA